MRNHHVEVGAQRLLQDDAALANLRTSNVALLAHGPTVVAGFEHLLDALIAVGVRPVRLFGPEHGLRGEAQDMIAVDQTVDPISGIPTVNLYGHTFESVRPKPSDFDGVDVLLIDLQDVGSRYYTYVYTAMLAAEVATQAGVSVIVLDRPNPIAGAVEGPTVEPGFESFVGLLPLPNQHGLTLAEVLRYAKNGGTAGGDTNSDTNSDTNGSVRRNIAFDTIAVGGWNRSLYYDQTTAPWVMPSPNMPTLDTAIVYPGMCLLEGTNLSEGRGTTRPFEIFGAPYIDAMRLKAELEAFALPGVAYRTLSYEPTFQKWARQRCSGLQLHVTDRSVFSSLTVGAAIIWACHKLFPEFAWRADAYEFVDEVPAIDLLFGSAAPRLAIESGAPFAEVSRLLQTPAALRERVLAARMNEYQ